MSGSGIIIEKQFVTIEAYGRVVRYRVVDRKASRDEYTMAGSANEEPSPGETMWWNADWIYFGPNDSKRLTRIGFSWSAV